MFVIYYSICSSHNNTISLIYCFCVKYHPLCKGFMIYDDRWLYFHRIIYFEAMNLGYCKLSRIQYYRCFGIIIIDIVNLIINIIKVYLIFCITLSLYLFSIKLKGRCWTRDVLRCWDVVQYPRCCTKIWRCPGMYRRCFQHLPYFQISVRPT